MICFLKFPGSIPLQLFDVGLHYPSSVFSLFNFDSTPRDVFICLFIFCFVFECGLLS